MPETIAESIAAVQKEMAAEAAAKPADEPKAEGKPIPVEALEELDKPKEAAEDKENGKVREGDDAEKAEKASDEEEKKPKKPPTADQLQARLNEETAKRRMADKKAKDLAAELEKARGPKGEPTPEEKIRADERAKVKAEEKRMRYLEQGQEVYGVDGFQTAESRLIELGFGVDLLDLAQEALSDRDAAKALYRLASEPAEKIEAFLGHTRARQAVDLAKLAARRKDVGEDEEEPEAKAEEPKAAPKPVRVSQAPAPITPMAPGAGQVIRNIFKPGQTDAEFDAALADEMKSSPKLAALLGRQ